MFKGAFCLELKMKGMSYILMIDIDRHTVVHFDSFGIEYIPQGVLNKTLLDYSN